MTRRRARTHLQNAVIAAAAVLTVGARYVPDRAAAPVAAAPSRPLSAALAVRGPVATYVTGGSARDDRAAGRSAELVAALGALEHAVASRSHPRALEDAFRSYYAYRAAHPDGTNPYLYFVDYGLPSTRPRGYVFDMAALRLVEGPFMVAHGRGSAAEGGVPRRFSNAFGSASTSLGLYVAQELYAFSGTANGRRYRSVGLRLAGLSGGFNSNARARGVVAHGAPYVTPGRAGRSEGCPAVEPDRARRILPKLARGGLVFLFAPDARWMAADPWLAHLAG
jgi:hypothetical protein